MFQRTKIYSGLLVAFGSATALVPSAHAQSAEAPVQRVEITGSSIRQVDAETSVPVTVIKVDDLKKQGVTSVEQILQSVSAVQVQQGTSQAVGSSTGGASFANLRGIGENKTLVLLNGRRIANNALDSSAPDLNMIPFSAIERVEVLRDGASSLYGTDAIGGVINFITRRDYTGGEITLGADKPSRAGGQSSTVNIGGGFGSLDKEGFNIFGFADFEKQAAITASQRSYSHRVVSGPSSNTFPGSYTAQTNVQATDPTTGLPAVDPTSGAPIYNTVTYTPFAAPECSAANHLYSKSDTQCGEVTGDFVNYIPKTDRMSGLLRLSAKVDDNNIFTLEGFASQARIDSVIAPTPYPGATISSSSPYYPGNGITPIPTGVTLLPDQGDIDITFRDLINGYREDINTNTQSRLVASLEGTIKDWDYNVAYALNTASSKDFLAHGYSNGDMIYAGLEDGTINPFGAQTAAGEAYILSAAKTGVLQVANGTVQTLDGHASHELPDWFKAGRPAAIAIGFEARHEHFENYIPDPEYAAQVYDSTGIDPTTFNAGTRNVFAGFFELNIPIVKSLDVTVAARYDKYSDFGNTTNPKVSFRFQPVKSFLLRGSYSTGFRAPSLYELNGSQIYTNTATVDDTKYCTVASDGTKTAAPGHSLACDQQFQALEGGNKNLKPEKSKNATFGIVLEPVKDLNVELDLWAISFTHTINGLADTTVFADEATYSSVFHRNPSGDLSVAASDCPGTDCGYVDLRNQNLGGVKTNGLDIATSYRMSLAGIGRLNFGYQGTYVHKYEYQNAEGGPWIQNVGIYSGTGPIFRWQHNGEVNWNFDPFSVGLAGHYKTGYLDSTPYSYDTDGNITAVHRVKDYYTLDVFATYAQAKGYSLTLGVKNLTDRAPPFTNQTETFQEGYDPRYTDPTGRTFYARGTYSF